MYYVCSKKYLGRLVRGNSTFLLKKITNVFECKCKYINLLKSNYHFLGSRSNADVLVARLCFYLL